MEIMASKIEWKKVFDCVFKEFEIQCLNDVFFLVKSSSRMIVFMFYNRQMLVAEN
jgi:hypothetical protein